MHLRRKKAFKEGISILGGKYLVLTMRHSERVVFSRILSFCIFLVIPGSWGVHRYPWFQNRSINMARADPDKHSRMNCALLYRLEGDRKGVHDMSKLLKKSYKEKLSNRGEGVKKVQS